jgi:hypothetical protein
MPSLIRTLLVPLALAALGAAPPQDAPSDQNIVVTAQTQKALRDFTEALSDTGPTGQIGRWKEFCPAVIGIQPEEAEFMVGRIGAVAESIGLHADSPGCRPRTLILFTTDATALASEFARHYPITLRTDGRGKLKRFVASALPIRWLSVTDPCGIGCTLPNSHIVMSTNPAFQAMIVIVDAKQIAEFNLGELSDYLAVIALSNPPLAAARPRDSILSMFAGPHPADRRFTLTGTDRSFLAGLYRSPTGMAADAQRGAIVTHMKRDRKKRQ